MAKKTTTSAAKTTKSKATEPLVAPDVAAAEPVKETKPRATAVPKTKAPKPSATTTEVTDEMIAEHAYHLWKNGHPGDHVEHWTEAERKLRGKK